MYWTKYIEELFNKEWRYWTLASAKTHFRFKFWLHKQDLILWIKSYLIFFISIYIFPFEYNSYIQKNIKYNPQGIKKKVIYKNCMKKASAYMRKKNQEWKVYIQEFTNFPKSILDFKTEKWLHPTQNQ